MATEARKPLLKDDRGIRARDILRTQFPSLNDDKLSGKLCAYKAKGLQLPTTKFYGSGKNACKEYNCHVVTNRAELNALIARFKDKSDCTPLSFRLE